MVTILDGKELSQKINDNVRYEIEAFFMPNNIPVPCLAVVLVGSNPASEVYVKNKMVACQKVGIQSTVVRLEADISQQKLNKTIKKLNTDPNVTAILLQLPLPKHLDAQEATNEISPEKDADGITNTNLGKLMCKDATGICGCTPRGIVELLRNYSIDVSGKDVVIINRSLLVGKPLSMILTNLDATVTICHHKTKNLKKICLQADIIIVAVGSKYFLKKNMVKKNAIVVDVGINRDEKTGKLCGDADFKRLKKRCSFITPVPGGVGPMTVAMLLQNTLDIAKSKLQTNNINNTQ